MREPEKAVHTSGVDGGSWIAVAALLALALFAQLPARPRIFAELNNFAHGPVFGALALVALIWMRPRIGTRLWHAYAAAFFIAVSAGAAIEALQILGQRDASLMDVVTDAVGAGCALSFALARDRSLRTAGRQSVFLVAGLVQLSLLLLPVGWAMFAYASRADQFPTLLQFKSALDLYFVETRDCEVALVAVSNEPKGQRQSGLRILFIGSDWPGISHSEPSPDWRGFERLRIEVTNPGNRPFRLGLRVDEIGRERRHEDRFNREFTIDAHTRAILSVRLAEIARAPARRNLNLARVGGIVLFRASVGDVQRSELVLSRIWLE